MKIISKNKLPASAAPVFIIGKGKKLENHQFFKALRPSDKKHLASVVRTFGTKEEYARVTALPSGPAYRPGRRTAVVVSIGERPLTARRAIVLARRIIVLAKTEKVKNIAVRLEDFLPRDKGEREGVDVSRAATAELLAAQFTLAHFDFTAHKTAPKEGWPEVREAVVVGAEAGMLRRGTMIAEEINKARSLSNTPGGDMTPRVLAEHALREGKAAGVNVKVLDEKEIAALKMGGVLGVAKGSAEKPRFIIMEYLAGPKDEQSVVVVGKGVTFDTGGLNLKPSQYIYEMHMDMSGGAAAIHLVTALARLKVKKNIIALVPAVENMPSGSSYRPGDILKTMSGKTIEVLDTDAEGRVILADALTYAHRYNPRLIVDIATLTGAAEVALGQRASALFTTDTTLEASLREAGEVTGDFVWPLPLWEEYEEEIKGTFGDWANIGKTRYGGAITGAVFLWQFVKDQPPATSNQQPASKKPGAGSRKLAPQWVHLDIAPRMTAVEGEYLAKGAAGASINLLTHFLETF